MPGRNLEKIYLEDAFYHIYNRGVNKQNIFIDDQDFSVFLNLLKRYLGDAPVQDQQGREYPWLHKEIELLAYCLMPNHYHLLIHQNKSDAMTKLLKSLNTTYSMYFNKKYHRIGPLFETRFKASMITRDDYLMHISRYIHLNPRHYKKWAFSSLPYYLGVQSATWLKPKKILDLFDTKKDYSDFLTDFEDYKRSLDAVKAELANT